MKQIVFIYLYFYSLHFQTETETVRGSKFKGNPMCSEFLVKLKNPSKSKGLCNASWLSFYYCAVLLGYLVISNLEDKRLSATSYDM